MRKQTFQITIVVVVGLVITALFNHCGRGAGQSGDGSLLHPPPGLLHVSNGISLGYYTSTGGYGFGSASNSVFNVSTGATAQMAQNSTTGVFVSGSSLGNYVTFLNGLFGGYLYSNLNNSEVPMSLRFTDKVAGVAFDTVRNIVYSINSTNKTITMVEGSSPIYVTGSLPGATITTSGWSPVPSALSYADVDSTQQRLFIVGGSELVIVDTKTNSQLASSPLTITSLPNACVTPSYIVVDNLVSRAYVLCQGSATTTAVVFNTNAIPGYAIAGSLTSSTLATTIPTAGDITPLHGRSAFAIVGGSKIFTYPSSGGTATTIDLSLSNCTGVSGITLSAATYAQSQDLLFVADSTNSLIFVLKSNLTFANGNCDNSRFATTAVSNPTRLTYY